MNRSPVRCLLISSALMLPLAAAMAQGQTADLHNDAGLLPIYEPIPVPAIVDPVEVEPVEVPPRDYSTSLQAIQDGTRTLTLDWRKAEQVLRFDLSETDHIDALTLTLLAKTDADSATNAPLTVAFNGGLKHAITPNEPTLIALDRKRARVQGNELRIAFASGCEAGHPQATHAPTTHPEAGGFTIDLRASKLDIQTRPNGDRLSMRGLEARLSGATFAPDTVGLIANGPMATRYQGLAAQGLALRMSDIPDFRTESVDTDFDLVMATRTELSALDDITLLTTDADVMMGVGPALVLSEAYPTRLYITGDTADEVLHAVSAFATAYLPPTHTGRVTPADILVQSPLDYDRRRLDGTIRLSALSVTTGATRTYRFDVADPEAMQGRLLLELKRDSRTRPGTRLSATLNGADLGRAVLDGRQKMAAYTIRPGLLVGTDNQLVLTTEDASDASHCGLSDPFIAIGNGSELQLTSATPSAPTDLSRLVADGSIFGAENGANTVFVLPEQTADYEHALAVVAQLAKVNGRGWTSATFSRGGTLDKDRHHLVIEPYADLDLAYKGAAPRAMKAAWRGEQVEGRNRVAAYARLNGEQAPAVGRFDQGGVAAIFPLDETRLVGLITNTPNANFSAVLDPLTGPVNWNGLAGGVARWSDNAVVSLQTPLASPVADIEPLMDADAEPRKDISGRSVAGLTLPALSLPDVELSNAGDWIHRRWRELSEDQATKAHPSAQPSTVAPATQAAERFDTLETPRGWAAQMDGGLMSRIDLWMSDTAHTARDDELHPFILGLIMLLLAGLSWFVLRRPARHTTDIDGP